MRLPCALKLFRSHTLTVSLRGNLKISKNIAMENMVTYGRKMTTVQRVPTRKMAPNAPPRFPYTTKEENGYFLVILALSFVDHLITYHENNGILGAVEFPSSLIQLKMVK